MSNNSIPANPAAIAASRWDASASGSFSLRQIRSVVAGLMDPNPTIYWADFLATISGGHLCFGLVRLLPRHLPGQTPAWVVAVVQAAAFFAACWLYYRALMFVHELVHLPEKRFRLFRLAWNLLCGIPLLTPSFTYWAHLDHHRRRSYGTREDGEYLALARLSQWSAAYYVAQGLLVPPLAVCRFLILTPLTWFSPRLRQWVHQRASSLVIDPSYLRPLPTAEALRTIRIQELLCFLWCLGVAGAVVCAGRWPFPFLLQAYATAAMVLSLNAVRTAAAHRWRSDGVEMTFVEQMLDTVTIDSDGPAAVILAPVGLRYHALHHLIPSLPYHNARAAHRRLLAELPPASPYRATVEPSIGAVLARLWRQTRKGGRPAVGSDIDRWKACPSN